MADKTDAGPAGTIEGLSEQQLKALLALARGSSITDVAAFVGVDRSTIHRWLKDPLFAAERERLKQERYDQLAARTLWLADEALATLESVMREAWQEKDRLAAAKMLLEMLGPPE